MARRISIPFTDTPDCQAYILVEYKLTGETGYSFSQQYFTNPAVIDNLADDTSYDFRVTRYCCNGVASTPVTFTFDTTPIDEPVGFSATQVGADVDLDWTAVTDATGYQVQRATDVDFTMDLTEVYEGALLTYLDLSPNAATYWYRVRTLRTGFGASDWNTTTITVS